MGNGSADAVSGGGEWGMGNGEWGVGEEGEDKKLLPCPPCLDSPLPTPHSLLPTPHSPYTQTITEAEGRAKIILPAEVCKADVTITLTSLP